MKKQSYTSTLSFPDVIAMFLSLIRATILFRRFAAGVIYYSLPSAQWDVVF